MENNFPTYFQEFSYIKHTNNQLTMHKYLIIKAFEKAEKDLKTGGNNNPSAVNISEEVESKTGFNLGARMYRDYYREAVKIVSTNQNTDININQLIVKNGLCQYLDFESYRDFVESLPQKERIKKPNNTEKENANTISIWIKRKKIIIVIGALLVTFFIIKVSINQQRWMIWEKDHFTEVPFNSKNYDQNILKTYNKERILKFRKINSPDCTTLFFNGKGEAIVWYWKKNDKEIELFNSAGLHPTNGKTLKPITSYMIQKYICKK
jgi:hypothetical protein